MGAWIGLGIYIHRPKLGWLQGQKNEKGHVLKGADFHPS